MILKRSFSLIEVIIACMIISIVSVALLKTTSNNRLFLKKFNQIQLQNQMLSFIAFIDINNKNKLFNDDYYLDDLLLKRYTFIKDDEVRKFFKNQKFHIKDKVITKTNLSDILSNISQSNNVQNISDLIIPVDIQIIQTSMKNNKFNKNLYKLRVEF